MNSGPTSNQKFWRQICNHLPNQQQHKRDGNRIYCLCLYVFINFGFVLDPWLLPHSSTSTSSASSKLRYRMQHIALHLVQWCMMYMFACTWCTSDPPLAQTSCICTHHLALPSCYTQEPVTSVWNSADRTSAAGPAVVASDPRGLFYGALQCVSPAAEAAAGGPHTGCQPQRAGRQWLLLHSLATRWLVGRLGSAAGRLSRV